MRFTLEEMRSIIARHKRWDYIFGLVGMLCLLVGILTLVLLFGQLLLQGMERLTPEFSPPFLPGMLNMPVSFPPGSARWRSCW